MGVKSLIRLIDGMINGINSRGRIVKWEKPHGKGTSGSNGFGDTFWLYDMSAAYPPERHWSLDAIPLCPDGRRFCHQHDEKPYWGPDRDEAKLAAQGWSDERYPLH